MASKNCQGLKGDFDTHRFFKKAAGEGRKYTLSFVGLVVNMIKVVFVVLVKEVLLNICHVVHVMSCCHSGIFLVCCAVLVLHWLVVVVVAAVGVVVLGGGGGGVVFVVVVVVVVVVVQW